jgi:ubiquinone/menaquinone biosynthesis C-methylase UbiE
VSLQSNIEWKRWARRDPLWAVCTEQERHRGGAEEWTVQEFYATGESDWRDFVPRWSRYGLRPDSCLEIGCGAGRITKQLCREFGKVCAVDVSEDMIERARAAIAASNVDYHVTDGLTLPLADRSQTAIFSTHVLQHLDNDEIVFAYFAEMFRVLDFGGSVMVHVLLCEWPGAGRIAGVHRVIHHALLKISGSLAWLKRKLDIGLMRSTSLHTLGLHSSLERIGFREIEFTTFATVRERRLYSFVMARK